MAKTKKVLNKPPRLSLVSHVIKRKSIKRNAAITPKLKKLRLAQAKSAVFEKTFSVSEEFEESEESENEPEATSTVILKSPKHFVKPVESPIDLNQVESGVKALFEYLQKNGEKKTDLFDDEQPIFLQISSIKVPRTPNRQIRLTLKHTLLSESSEICLIVRDEGKAKDHDGTIEHYEDLLKDKGVINIKTIIPYHQFKTEYGNQYELVRKLLGLYDYFLVDGRVGGYVTHRLGKIFLEKRKMPTPVKMEATNLKEHFEASLRKTLMKLHSKSDYYIVQVGHSKMDQNDVYENVSAIIDELGREFPGGLDNIRSLGIKTDKSLAVPIYLTLKNKSTVNVPVALAKRPKQFQKVTGELTTFLDKDVTVLPTGEIIVTEQELEDEEFPSDYEDLESDLEEEEEIVDDSENPSGGSDEEDAEDDVKIKEVKEKSVEEEEDEGILDQAEEIYLNQYEQEQTNTRKTKKAMAETEEKAKKVPNKKITKKPAQKQEQTKQKKTTKGKKQVAVEGDKDVLVQVEEQTEVVTRTMRTRKPKPDKEIPLKETKKQTKKDKVVEKTKPKGKKEEQEKKVVEPKKQKASKKASETSLEQENTTTKKTRKTKAKTVEEVIPAKKTKINKKSNEEEKPSKRKIETKFTVATNDKADVVKKSRKRRSPSTQENVEVVAKPIKVKIIKQKENVAKASKKGVKATPKEPNSPVNKKSKKVAEKENSKVQKKGKDKKIKSPTVKVKKGKK